MEQFLESIQPASQLRVVSTGILSQPGCKKQLAIGQTKEQQKNQSQLHSTVRNVSKIDSTAIARTHPSENRARVGHPQVLLPCGAALMGHRWFAFATSEKTCRF
jgi:hypothetical protein